MADRSLTDSDVALRAALAGAEVARRRYGADNRRFEHEGADFSTEADIEAERAIRAVLMDLRPTDAVVGEELETTGDSSRRWLVDPICGTLNFAAQVPVFAVNVALDIDGDTTAAAVVDPVAAHVFWADGTSAFGRVGAATADRLLAPTPVSRLVSVNLESEYEGGSGIRLLSDEMLRTRFSPRCFSSTLALAWVASGQQAAYITGGDLRGSVHWTAGIAVCRAAGTVVTNLAGGELHTGDHGLIAAADAETHAFLLERLNALS
ncbi:MAG: inositol monophosphatase family protein [Microbacterium sp.]